MSTEFFLKGDPHEIEYEFGCKVGIGGRRSCFNWNVHPEFGLQAVASADGAQDAWGREYTFDEFLVELRDCKRQTGPGEIGRSRLVLGKILGSKVEVRRST